LKEIDDEIIERFFGCGSPIHPASIKTDEVAGNCSGGACC